MFTQPLLRGGRAWLALVVVIVVVFLSIEGSMLWDRKLETTSSLIRNGDFQLGLMAWDVGGCRALNLRFESANGMKAMISACISSPPVPSWNGESFPTSQCHN
jgi:hypothetical protein